jgi:glycosyltransferase involved in cell wall biosynthesis
MDEIKVFLQYPWKFPDSSYYKNIVNFPPQGVNFVNYNNESNKKFEIIASSDKFERMRKFKNIIRKILGIIKIPNLTYTKNKNYDLIHCAHCLSLNRRPWVVDTETYDRISAGGDIANSKLGKWIIKKRFESFYCKKIICWSEDCKKTFLEAFPANKKILDKIEILPFALPIPKFKKIPHKNLRILFVARWFDAKGGRQTLEVFDRLSKKYHNIEFIFICPTPKEFKEKYSDNKSIKIMELVPQDRLFNEIYPSCDIFFYPGFGDSYGFAVPEALSYGLPIITSNTFTKKELVSNNTGFLVDLPKSWKDYECMDENMLNDFVDKTEILIKNKGLRDKMSHAAIKEAQEKFSIEKRNEKLRKIYEEAIS